MPMSQAEASLAPPWCVTDEIQVVIEVPKLQAQIIFDKKILAEVHELHKQSPLTRAKKSLRSREPAVERTRKHAAELDLLMAHRVDEMGDSRLKVLEAHKLQQHVIHAKSEPYRYPRVPQARNRSVTKAMMPPL